MDSNGDLDWPAVHRAVEKRIEQLKAEIKGGRFTKGDLAARMGMDRKTVTNLCRSRVEVDTLRAASQALEWPRDGLERIGQGEDPSTLERRPWLPAPTEHERTLALLGEIKQEVAALSDRVSRLEDAQGVRRGGSDQ